MGYLTLTFISNALLENMAKRQDSLTIKQKAKQRKSFLIQICFGFGTSDDNNPDALSINKTLENGMQQIERKLNTQAGIKDNYNNDNNCIMITRIINMLM